MADHSKTMKTGFRALVLADSYSRADPCYRLTTLEVTFPRFILAELNTHRVLTRNSASSRAIPVRRRIEALLASPFVPEVWYRNKAGMQGGEPLADADAAEARRVWLALRDQAVASLRALGRLGVHKQHANRIVEPWLWHTAIVSATEWANFFGLRISDQAQPEFNTLATMMRDAMDASQPEALDVDQWHLPMVSGAELRQVRAYEAEAAAWPGNTTDEVSTYAAESDTPPSPLRLALERSVARCARVSYETHDTGEVSLYRDRELFTRLLTGGHMSPFEHQAVVSPRLMRQEGNFVGFTQYRKFVPAEANPAHHRQMGL